MKPLKTLKDLDINDITDRKGFTVPVVDIEELKAEAIRWAKKYNFLETHPFCWFHNISEEDLA